MKFFIAVLALAAFVAAENEWMPKPKDEMKAIRAMCLAENPIPDEYMEKMKMFEYAPVKPVKKYLMCTLIKTGLFCEDEGLHVERVIKQFGMKLDEDDSIKGVVEKCADKNEEKSNADEWAYRSFMCLFNSKLGETIREYIKAAMETA